MGAGTFRGGLSREEVGLGFGEAVETPAGGDDLVEEGLLERGLGVEVVAHLADESLEGEVVFGGEMGEGGADSMLQSIL